MKGSNFGKGLPVWVSNLLGKAGAVGAAVAVGAGGAHGIEKAGAVGAAGTTGSGWIGADMAIG